LLRTKIRPVKKSTNRLFFVVALAIFGAGCAPRSEVLYEQALSEIQKGHFRIAVDLLERSAKVEKNDLNRNRYLSEAGRIVRFEIQDYERAIRIFRKIILDSDDEAQRLQSQEAVAEIYLENLQDYQSALKELQMLEPLLKDTKKKEKTKLRIAQTLYLTGNYQQALEEIEAAQKYFLVQEFNFSKLKGEILTAQKKYKEAIANYDGLRQKYPEQFAKENLFIAASIVFEENEQYSDALSYLKKYETQITDKVYFELRIKRLKERLDNKPLSRGPRK
jgi:tetratricopeptide (TPR) repeat protein